MTKQDCIVSVEVSEDFDSSTNDPMVSSGLSNLLTVAKKKPVVPKGAAGGCCCTCSSCC